MAYESLKKLRTEASQTDHNLRLLVSHANLLDAIMEEIDNVEDEQESLFQGTIYTQTRSKRSPSVSFAEPLKRTSR